MKKLILLIPALPAFALVLSSCTTVVKEPVPTTTTTTRTTEVERTPTSTSTTVTRQSAGGY
ncbi:MAG TPA: hypothetical protein VH207_11420 [Chthoniobacterales bacterium]|nr:hypothetical protein [Chthoniobacterales bacterium]